MTTFIYKTLPFNKNKISWTCQPDSDAGLICDDYLDSEFMTVTSNDMLYCLKHF